jgi:hypothetical protein
MAFGVADRAAAATAFTGQFGAGGTWNVYELINTNMTWEEAWRFAPTRENPIAGNTAVGHLVTLTDVAENNFVHMQGGMGDLWIGLTDRVGIQTAFESINGFFPTDEGWAWVTGEPYTFDDPDTTALGYWGRDAMGVFTEPNNSGGEDAAHIRGDGRWNDHQSGFSANEPAASADNTAEGQQTFRFVIEWDTMLPSMPTGFPMTRPDPPIPPVDPVFPTPLARLPGQDGTATTFGVTDRTGSGASVDTRDAIARYLGTTGTLVNGSATKFDINDPEAGGIAGSVLGTPIPIPSNTAADDNNFQEVVKGTFQVPSGQGGLYTFNVRSDDGFAMRILSQPTGGSLTQHEFTSSRNGRVDQDGTLVFLAPTGDSNTQGVINLAPGTYDVEFIWFENGGGAFAEVSTHKGDLIANPLTNHIPQWILLGDGTSLPEQERPFKQPARLTGQVTAKNRARGTITNVAQIVADWRANPTPTHEGMFNEVVFNGDGGNGIQGANAGPGNVHQFPNGTGVDQFTTSVTGEFTVLDTNGTAGETMTFALLSDDNAGLHIIGQNFTGVSDFDGTPTTNIATLGNPEGLSDQWLIADYRTGNTNAFGLITLQDNTTYDFEAFMLEEGGGAVLEVWVAPGDQLATGFDPTKFYPLTVDVAPSLLSANTGLGLVQGPGTGPSGGTAIPGDYNEDGKVDTADYVVWRKNNINGQQGYDDWRANYGRTSGSGSALSAVPEPATGLLVVLGLVGGALAARRRAG